MIDFVSLMTIITQYLKNTEGREKKPLSLFYSKNDVFFSPFLFIFI